MDEDEKFYPKPKEKGAADISTQSKFSIGSLCDKLTPRSWIDDFFVFKPGFSLSNFLYYLPNYMFLYVLLSTICLVSFSLVEKTLFVFGFLLFMEILRACVSLTIDIPGFLHVLFVFFEIAVVCWASDFSIGVMIGQAIWIFFVTLHMSLFSPLQPPPSGTFRLESGN
eukprot:c22090_g1_i1.p1 GENE.c22090_g1_i1~~c22090_g1_i1.p1  ORF type:complete len:175 (+),score=40.96 c22090_g1_i1:22-525(+)